MPPVAERRAAVFLDRDGTLIRERHYLGDPAGVQLLPGAAEAVRRLRAAGFSVVLVTNQSGIARGLFTWDEFRATQRRLEGLLAEQGALLDGVYVCAHHPNFTGPCDCRKPKPRLFLQAADELTLDLGRSFFLGDRWRDVAAAEEVGGTPILLASHEPGEKRPAHVPVVPNLAAAAEYVLAHAGERVASSRRRRGST